MPCSILNDAAPAASRPAARAAAPAAAPETDAELDAELDAMDTPLYKRPLVLAAGAAGAYLLWTNRKKIKAKLKG